MARVAVLGGSGLYDPRSSGKYGGSGASRGRRILPRRSRRSTPEDHLAHAHQLDTVGTATSSIQELYDIYKIACGGSNCNLADNVTWPILSSAAQTKYGFTPQFFQFDQDGLVFGVSNDPGL
jgi:hypothetical protein